MTLGRIHLISFLSQKYIHQYPHLPLSLLSQARTLTQVPDLISDSFRTSAFNYYLRISISFSSLAAPSHPSFSILSPYKLPPSFFFSFLTFILFPDHCDITVFPLHFRNFTNATTKCFNSSSYIPSL